MNLFLSSCVKKDEFIFVVVCGDVNEKPRNQSDEILRKSEQSFVNFEMIYSIAVYIFKESELYYMYEIEIRVNNNEQCFRNRIYI